MLYGRLDELRNRAADRLARVLRETGGTHQARSEREVFSTMYARQISQFNAAENGLCFGRLDFHHGERRYIGRIGLHDDSGDYEQLLMDWRADAARPFYLATAASPVDVRRRRHIKTRGRTVVGVDDEVLDLTTADPSKHEGLTGESALLAALGASRTGRMRDIVETIQAEQDQIIRSGLAGVLVVQGGPGTGKTAVALHRAAFLLYTYRRQLTSGACSWSARTPRSCAISARSCPLSARQACCCPPWPTSTRASARPAASHPPRPRSRAGWPWPVSWPRRCGTGSTCPAGRSRWSSTPRRYASARPCAAGPESGPGARAGRTTRHGGCSPGS